MKIKCWMGIFLSFMTSLYVDAITKIEWPNIQSLNVFKTRKYKNFTSIKKKNIPGPALIYEITESKLTSSTSTPETPTLIVDIKIIQNTTSKSSSLNFARELTSKKNGFSKQNKISKFVQNPKINFIDFDFEIDDFVNFEQKKGLIELSSKIVYKWWEESLDNNFINDFSRIIYSKESHFPTLMVKDKNCEYQIHNQVHVKNNFKVFLQAKRDTKKDKTRALNSTKSLKPVYSALINQNDSIKKKLQQFSYIEQNVTLKFKCMSINNQFLDFTSFPFDSHNCEINFEILPSVLTKLKNPVIPEPIFLFSLSDLNFKKKRNFLENSFTETIYFNKLVSIPSNYSLLSKEWILKKLEIKYTNSTSLLSPQLDQNISVQTPSSITLKFLIQRKREPQVYIFILPLILFTLITFIIFFMPNTESSEKTIISFFNFIALIFFNIYIFKLVIYSYGFSQLPLILQYSNCLMIIQLGVLAYTCLVKSVHLNGFLILNNSFNQSIEESYREILNLNEDNLINTDVSNFDLALNDQLGYYRLDKTETEILENENNFEQFASVPTLKLELENEALNEIATTEVNDEQFCFTFNRTDSNTKAEKVEKTCCCNSEETDADCLNNSAHCMAQNKLSMNEFINNLKRSQASFEKNELMVSMNNGLNRNWIFSCCGTRSPDIGKFSPSPVCEHVRPSDLHRLKLSGDEKKMYCVSQASTRQVMPECDYTSHLARVQDPIKLNDLNQTTKNISFKVKQNFMDTMRSSGQIKNESSQKLDKLSKFLSSSSLEITKLNMNMKKMVKLEEIVIRDRINKEEWKRKARLCDGICCLLVFFLLGVCSLFIFVILPKFKTASLID
ncbi:unnamed protein product [Brachionus calyciflorus]|uniref:Uncharacterized protein n=1 Tax=Brachionus calyciflorus TaxID=104777 RepID=A0A814C2W6_9BILA|nr:unnamed protein product [Brachionus calyciflorus]